MIITIDGPTASGKSTVAQILAKREGLMYLSSGWLYRAVAYVLVRDYGYDAQRLENPLQEDVVSCLDMKRLVYVYDIDRGGILYFDGVDITPFLKDYTVDRLVALLSPIPFVRVLISQAQRDRVLQVKNAIVEGRDTGSVVFPDADFSFFLTASLEVRAARWQKDQAKRGHAFSLQESMDAVHMRDTKDIERAHSPLIIPRNATVIDCSCMSADQVVEQMHALIYKK